MKHIYDIVGIGFGPSNLALAAVIEEQSMNKPCAIFFESKSSFNWHPHMLLSGAEMQIPFLKDLATLRNPSSPYTFLNYLHNVGRLDTFTNLRNFYPSRIEFNDYLKWAANKLKNYVKYACKVIDIIPYEKNILQIIFEHEKKTSSVLAYNIVVAAGGIPNIPAGIKKDSSSQRIWHTSEYLRNIARYKSQTHAPYHFCVVGGGQSAAEIIHDLHLSFPDSKITSIHTGFGFKASDNSEFINEVFFPENVDLFYTSTELMRKKMLDSHADTNYAVVDHELIQKLYKIKYEESVVGRQRLFFKRFSTLESARVINESVEVCIKNTLLPGELSKLTVDHLILATGYDFTQPAPMLKNISPYFLAHSSSSSPLVNRQYKVLTTPELKAGIYLQGYNESTHGLSDTLLSVSSVRAQHIVDQIIAKKIHETKNINSFIKKRVKAKLSNVC